MDGARFDALTRWFGQPRSRRRFTHLLASGVALAVGLDRDDRASAQATCIPSKRPCQTTAQCCRGACVGNICVATCSEVDAICEQTLDCCSGLDCVVVNGTPRCRPQSCAAHGERCQSDDECCEGVCHRHKDAGSDPASEGRCRPQR